MVRSRFAAQMELLNTELIVMGTLCENALEHVMQALQEDNDALNREIIILNIIISARKKELYTKLCTAPSLCYLVTVCSLLICVRFQRR